MPSKPKEWYQTHREDIKRYNRVSYQNHREECLARMKVYRETHKEEIAANKKNWHKEWTKILKFEVFTHYSQNGKPECGRCGITDIDILCLDHINGNGGGRIRRGGWMLYKKLREKGYPEGFQVLCANCNLKKEIQEDLSRAC